MREICQSGSEGRETDNHRSSLPLSVGLESFFAAFSGNGLRTLSHAGGRPSMRRQALIWPRWVVTWPVT